MAHEDEDEDEVLEAQTTEERSDTDTASKRSLAHRYLMCSRAQSVYAPSGAPTASNPPLDPWGAATLTSNADRLAKAASVSKSAGRSPGARSISPATSTLARPSERAAKGGDGGCAGPSTV